MGGSILRVVAARKRDLGGFTVDRILPYAGGQGVGPFVFLDHMGPVGFAPGTTEGDVRPHPHIGLATVTWLFDGEMVHRDSVGSLSTIRPGELNWMTAGRGIAHSERVPADVRARGAALHGMQAWVALPTQLEETDPAFAHHPAAELPLIERGGARLRVIAGSAYGAESPAKVLSPLFYVDAALDAGAALELPDGYAERAFYMVEGAVTVDGTPIAPRTLPIAAAGARVRIEASAPSRVLLLGGEPLGVRHLWWNFVSSSKERIERAKADWKAQRFAPIPGETEFIPLPER
jgi:redox-sensitive bicupin YhaK (pirin superfamily)